MSAACSATRRSSTPILARDPRRARRAAFGIGREEKVAVNDIMSVTETAAHLVDGLEGRARAFVQVQNGCDHRCTFCIIPYGRGNSRSVPMGEVVAQVRRLVRARLSRDRAHRRRSHELWREPAGRAEARHAGEADPQARAGARAAAAVVDRFGRGRPRPDRRLRQRAAADAASASVAAGRRRHDPQAHEAPAFARRRDRVLRCNCGGCGRTSCSAPTSSPASRPRPRRCLRARSISSTNAGSRICTCSRSRRARARRRRRCRRCARAVVKERARRLREKGAAALVRHLDGEVGSAAPRADGVRRYRPHRAVHAGAARVGGRAGAIVDVDDRRPRRAAVAGASDGRRSAAIVSGCQLREFAVFLRFRRGQ